MEIISADKAPEAAGPYSQAIVSGNLIFVSGQLGIDKDGNLGKNIVEQTENAIKNLSEILLAAGSSLKKLLKRLAFLPISKTLRRLTRRTENILQRNRPGV